MEVKFATYNVRGLRNSLKRVDIFKQLLKNKFSVIALQETHCTADVVDIWKEEWPGESVWTLGSPTHAGVAFLFHPDLDIEIINNFEAIPDRILRLNVKLHGIDLQLLNIYGYTSNTEDAAEIFFYRANQALTFEPPSIILGDFNMVESPSLDRLGGNSRTHHTYGIKNLNELKEDCDVVDIWRTRNPTGRSYTWTSPNGNIRSRLDRIYISKLFVPLVSTSYVVQTPFSDHDICVCETGLPSITPRGPGRWRLNVEYLSHERYQNEITEFFEHWKTQKHLYQNLQDWWDLAKIYFKSISIQYAVELNKHIRQDQARIMSLIEQEQQSSSPDKVKINDLWDELKLIEREKSKKVFIFTHTAVRESDEKPTKYFYSLLRERKSKSALDKLVTDEGDTLSSPAEVLAETRNFYKNLFSEEKNISQKHQDFFLKKVKTKLTRDQRNALETHLTLKNLEDALFQAEKEKSPGDDGLPYEFYTTFWHILSEDFLEVTSQSLYVDELLPKSQRRSVIILIHKRGDKTRLVNWRPISLLNTDYKIIAKALSNRLRNVLATLLHSTQTANVPGRTIFENLFLIRDTLEYCDRHKIDGYLISIDQEKAFDKTHRPFLYSVLETMGFGPVFINTIKCLYQDITASVSVNGFSSTSFDLERGLKQGGPLSSQLYDIYIEPLAEAVRTDPNIKGIPLPGGQEATSSHFADDANFFLLATTQICYLFHVFDKFRSATGSTINASKTQGLHFGNPNFSDPYLKLVQWKNIDGGLKILGITFHVKFTDTQTSNWKTITTKVSNHISTLRKRNLSFKGKVLILNTVTLAKAWYVATVIPCNEDQEKALRKIIFPFLWKSRWNTISHAMSYQPKDKGGLNLKSLRLQQQALQLKFMSQITDPNINDLWVTLPRYWIGFHLAPLHPDWSFLRSNSQPHLDTPLDREGRHKLIGAEGRPSFYHDLFLETEKLDLKTVFWVTSEIYKSYITLNYYFPKAFLTHWHRFNYNPDVIWKLVYASFAQGRHQDIHFKYLHLKTPCKDFLRKQSEKSGRTFHWSNTNCKFCPIIENQDHIFLDCPQADLLWKYVFPAIRAILKPHSFRLQDLIAGHFHNDTNFNKRKLVLTIIQITMHTLWLNRNSFLFNKVVEHPTFRKSRNAIKLTFHRVILTQFKNHLPHQLAKFRKHFCHTPSVVNVINDDSLYTHFIK